MSTTDILSGDALLKLLGLHADAPPVQCALAKLAHDMQPELDPEDEDDLVDWITVHELGIEFGFEDEAYVLALDSKFRREGPLLLSQIYFYGDTPTTQPFPHPLPFGLTFDDDATAVRQKLFEHEATRRSHIRDTWRLPSFKVVAEYRPGSSRLTSVFCYLPYAPWPVLPGEAELVACFSPETFTGLFGRRWSNAHLRATLAPLGFEAKLPQVRMENTADLRLEHGLEFIFAPSSDIRAADRKYPKALAFAGVVYYAARELDAREWAGDLPLGISFEDTRDDLRDKVGKAPAFASDSTLSGEMVWRLDDFTLSILYSNLENRSLRISQMAPGYWEATIS